MSRAHWLCLDVGNSDTVGAVFDPRNSMTEIKELFRFPTHSPEWQSSLIAALPKDTTRVVIASVVPSKNVQIKSLLTSLESHWISSQSQRDFDIDLPIPEQLGADRLANAAAATALFKTPLLIVDAGTATKFCVIDFRNFTDFRDSRPAHLGGAIAPGLGISANALRLSAPHLPPIPGEAQARVLGKTTAEQLQSGLYSGHSAMIQNLSDQLLIEAQVRGAKKILTGGYAHALKPGEEYCSIPYLTLMGIARYGQLNF